MLVIDLGSYAQYLSLQLPIDEIVIVLPVSLLIGIVLYLILKRVPIVSNIIEIFIVTVVSSVILFIPLIIFFEFLELYFIKRVLILIVALFMIFMFAIFNSRAVIEFVKESRSFDNA